VIVEHDRALIEAADYVIEMGPGSGERGGAMVFAGTRRSSARTALVDRALPERATRSSARSPPEGRRDLVLEGARAHT